MASSRGSSEDPTKMELIKDALYQAVADSGSEGRLWNQKDLLELDVIPEQNLVLLMKAVQALTQDFLFKAMNDGRFGLCWRYRPAEDAAKYKQLNQDQIMVYELIDDAGSDGIWARSLKTRLNMHDSVLKQCLKVLETKGFIRAMKSVENIGKKMYIKATLRPSERATGGAWYTDSTFDEAFIIDLQEIVFNAICDRSSYLSRHSSSSRRPTSTSTSTSASAPTTKQPKKGVVRGGAADAGSDTAPRGRKRGADALSTGDDAHGHAHAHQHHRSHRRSGRHGAEVRLPMPAGYTGYPTVRQIAERIEKSGVTNNTTLSEADIQQLVDVLVYDGLLEAVRLPHSTETGYRVLNAVRMGGSGSGASGPQEEAATDAGTGTGAPQPQRPSQLGAPPMTNGLSETPCGLCPVFDLCEDGGPVSPDNCLYFSRWLGLDDATPPPATEQVGVDVMGL